MDESIAGADGASRRKFIAGAAGAAAASGAALIATSSPAGASVSTTNNVDLGDISAANSALKWIDFGSGTLTRVDLGTGGFARANFVPMGEAVAMDLRLQVGTGANLGTGPWCLDSSEFAALGLGGFEPANLHTDISGQINSSWVGMGTIYNVWSDNQKQILIGCAWGNFDPFSLGHLLVWGLMDRDNNGSGNVMLNWNGTVPYGTAPAAGTVLYTSLTYQIAPGA
ncbi:MAG: hypothetical protein U0Q22_19015 [Acidimicrobiales bacterium]